MSRISKKKLVDATKEKRSLTNSETFLNDVDSLNKRICEHVRMLDATVAGSAKFKLIEDLTLGTGSPSAVNLVGVEVLLSLFIDMKATINRIVYGVVNDIDDDNDNDILLHKVFEFVTEAYNLWCTVSNVAIDSENTLLKIIQLKMNDNMDVLKRKGNDYNNSSAFDSFIRTSKIMKSPKSVINTTDIDPLQVALTMISWKLSRIANLLASGKEVKNESISDSIVDMINYVYLVLGIIKDRDLIIN